MAGDMASEWQAHGKRMAGHGRKSDSIAQGIGKRRTGLLGDEILLPWAYENAEPASSNVRICRTVDDFGEGGLLGDQLLLPWA